MDHLYVDGRHYDRLFSPSGDIEFFVDRGRLIFPSKSDGRISR
jgi:hypothetical protein